MSTGDGDTGNAAEATVQQDNSQAPDSKIQSEATVASENETTTSESQVTVAEQEAVAENRQIAALGPTSTQTDTAAPVESAEAPSQAAPGITNQQPEKMDTVEDDKPYAPILGNIKLKRDDTLSLVIQKVYGSFNSKYFRSLILANPVIDDPDLVDVDQTIYLPAIPVSVGITGRKACWVMLDEKDDLNAAYDYLRNYPANAPPARLLPYWNRQAGTRFAIVLKKYFSDSTSALEQLDRVPTVLAPGGKVLSSWNKDTVFFANPFLRSSQASPIQAQGE